MAPAQTGAPTPAPRDGTSNIEVIALATDKVKGNWDVGIRSIEFATTGKLVGKMIPTVRPFDFVNQFVWDPIRPGNIQDYDALNISDLTRVAYENDYRSPSNAAKSAGMVSYFHILTNTDAANTIVDFVDRTRYWRSKVTQGAAWNDINSTEAVNNAKGAFPDDYYTFTITAKDAAGNAATKTSKVLLDNWQQTIKVVPVVGTLDKYTVTGTNWTANSKVPLRLVKTLGGAAGFVDGVQVAEFQVEQFPDLVPDADGNIPPTVITVGAHPEVGNIPLVFFADYHDGDGIYEQRLDAIEPAQDSKATQNQTPVADESQALVAFDFTSPSGGSGSGSGRFVAPAPLRVTRPVPTADDPGSARLVAPAVALIVLRPASGPSEVSSDPAPLSLPPI